MRITSLISYDPSSFISHHSLGVLNYLSSYIISNDGLTAIIHLKNQESSKRAS